MKLGFSGALGVCMGRFYVRFGARPVMGAKPPLKYFPPSGKMCWM